MNQDHMYAYVGNNIELPSEQSEHSGQIQADRLRKPDELATLKNELMKDLSKEFVQPANRKRPRSIDLTPDDDQVSVCASKYGLIDPPQEGNPYLPEEISSERFRE